MVSNTDKLHWFYISGPWRDLSYKLKIERGGKCKKCGAVITDMSQLIAHHTIELTEENVNDPNIALNPNYIVLDCFTCHNIDHRRFGSAKHVYIVHGSPLSGKNTAVRQMMRYGDLVMDLDAIWFAISGQAEYIKPDNLRFNVFKLRDELLDQIKTRYGQWYDCYVIGGYPDKYERERLAERLGAELIHCDTSKEECIKRWEQSGRSKLWLDYIEDYWRRYNG